MWVPRLGMARLGPGLRGCSVYTARAQQRRGSQHLQAACSLLGRCCSWATGACKPQGSLTAQGVKGILQDLTTLRPTFLIGAPRVYDRFQMVSMSAVRWHAC